MSACIGKVSGDYDVFHPGDHVIVTEGDRQTDAVIVEPLQERVPIFPGARPTPQFDVDAYWYRYRKDGLMTFWNHHASYFTRVKTKASSETPAVMYESGDPILVGDVVTWTKRPGSDVEYMGRGSRRNAASGVHQNQELWSEGSEAPEYTVHKILKNGSIRINAGSDPCIADAWTRYVNVPPSELVQTGRSEC